MPATRLSLKSIWKKVVILFAVGVALSVLRGALFDRANGTFLTDTFFTIGSVFLCFGVGGLLRNLGIFNSLKYGFKSLYNMFRGKKREPADKMEGGYLEYVSSRPKSGDVKWMMVFAALFLTLSVLFALPLL